MTDFKEKAEIFNSSFVKECSLIKTQPAITCSKLTTETLEQDVKYVQS